MAILCTKSIAILLAHFFSVTAPDRTGHFAVILLLVIVRYNLFTGRACRPIV